MADPIWNTEYFGGEWRAFGSADLSGGGASGSCGVGKPGWVTIFQGSFLDAVLPMPEPGLIADWPYARIMVSARPIIFGARGSLGCAAGGSLLDIAININVLVGGEVRSFSEFPLTFAPSEIPEIMIQVTGVYGAMIVALAIVLQRWNGPIADPDPPPIVIPPNPVDPYQDVIFTPLPFPGCAKGFPPDFGGVDAGVVEQ